MIAKKKERQIVIANKINEARYRMTTTEHKMFLYCIGSVNNDDKKINNYFEITTKAFANYLGVSSTNLYRDMKNITDGLTNKTIEIKTGAESHIRMPVIERLEFNNGLIKIHINKHLAPYLLDLKNNFTKYYLKDVIHFKSNYSIRIYQLLSQYVNLKFVTYDIEKLKHLLNIDSSQYNNYADFKRYVLNKAQNEIGKDKIISFTYKEIKIVKKVKSIQFTIN